LLNARYFKAALPVAEVHQVILAPDWRTAMDFIVSEETGF
jgi:hypothetical protein